jgi:hypothetical protein
VPVGVLLFDEVDFLESRPGFDLLLAADGGLDACVWFEPDQFVDVVFLGEAGEQFLLML